MNLLLILIVLGILLSHLVSKDGNLGSQALVFVNKLSVGLHTFLQVIGILVVNLALHLGLAQSLLKL